MERTFLWSAMATHGLENKAKCIVWKWKHGVHQFYMYINWIHTYIVVIQLLPANLHLITGCACIQKIFKKRRKCIEKSIFLCHIEVIMVAPMLYDFTDFTARQRYGFADFTLCFHLICAGIYSTEWPWISWLQVSSLFSPFGNVICLIVTK